MPKYDVNGKRYNIPDEKAAEFVKDFPEAAVSIFDDNGEEYMLPVSKLSAFQSAYPGWSYNAKGATALGAGIAKTAANTNRNEETNHSDEKKEADEEGEKPLCQI